MTVMFQLRLLDDQRRVLAWNHVPAETRGDGAIWPTQGLVAEAQETGLAVALNIFWPDLNYWTTVPLPQAVQVEAGKVVSLALTEPFLRATSEPLPCPSVTVRQPVHMAIGAATR